MVVISNFHGYEVYYDFEKKDWFYTDDNTSATKNERPCKRCGEYMIDDGNLRFDYCLGYLGENVTSACCGHGARKGFILFEDGRLFEESDWGDD